MQTCLEIEKANIMGRDIYFYRAGNFEQLDDESDEDFYDRRCLGSVDLGSGDAWPCYFRPIMVGAFKRIASLSEMPEEKKETLKKAILRACPPSHLKTNNDNMRCGYIHQSSVTSFSGMSIHRQNILDERNLFDEEQQLNLYEAGVWSIVELVLMHNRMCLTTPTIRRVSEMMELVRDFVPFSNDDLKGTPYGEVDESYNVADERWVDLFDKFKKASLEENIYAIIE